MKSISPANMLTILSDTPAMTATTSLPFIPSARNPTTPKALMYPGSELVALTMLLNARWKKSITGFMASMAIAPPISVFSKPVTMACPNPCAAFSMLSKLFVIALSNTPMIAFNLSNGPASDMIFLMLKNLSCTIDCRPSKLLANATAAPANSPFGPKTLSNASCVSIVVTLTPSLNPSSALIPRSLNRSADDIPPDSALWICSPASLKSSPDMAATLAVSCKFFPNSSASFDTTAKLPDAAAISSSVNGTVPANLLNVSNALAPSSADPKRNLNLVC